MAFIGYLGMFYGPLSNLTHVSQAMNRFVTISQRTFELLDEMEQAQPAQPKSKPQIAGSVVFDHVTFGYDPYFPVINDVSFEVKPGEMIGVVGHSGAGKTTLVNLMCRFYDVTGGSVRIDGVDIRDLSMSEIRQQVGMVLQSPTSSTARWPKHRLRQAMPPTPRSCVRPRLPMPTTLSRRCPRAMTPSWAKAAVASPVASASSPAPSEILGLRVPLPTLVLNNEADPLFTLPEMQRADRMLAGIYGKAGASERYRCTFYPGPHKFEPDMQAEAFNWFERWLKDAV